MEESGRRPEGLGWGAATRLVETVFGAVRRRSPQGAQPAWLLLRDPLTGLYSRDALLRSMAREIAVAPMRAPRSALLLVAVDGIGAAQDRWGGEAADSLRYSSAVRLRERLRDAQCLSRVGSAEYALLLHGVDGAHGAARMQRLLGAVRLALQTPSASACGISHCCDRPLRFGWALLRAAVPAPRALDAAYRALRVLPAGALACAPACASTCASTCPGPSTVPARCGVATGD